MSKVSRRELSIPINVKLKYLDNVLTVEGPKGTLVKDIHRDVFLEINDEDRILRTIYNGSKRSRDMRKKYPIVGTFNSIINSMIIGVTNGYSRIFKVEGVGYKVVKDKDNNRLVFSLGYSHNKFLDIPEGISVIDSKIANEISIESLDKQRIGWFSKILENLRPRSPYKKRGIYEKGEEVRLKVGKSNK